jgi:alanyl-tRNA synthetase
LLHWALRHILGDHVKQAGSLVDANGLRFDFSHFQGLTSEEMLKIEEAVNRVIWQALPVAKKVMGKEQATSMGAIAFFGEKYGDEVRVVSVGDVSVELCGGTHVNNSSDIQMFKILSESSIAAGVRRIIATTSETAYRHLTAQEQELNGVLEKLKVQNRKDLDGRIEKLLAAERDLKKFQETMRTQQIVVESDSLIAQAKTVKAGAIIVGLCQADDTGAKKLRDLAERIKQKQPNAAVVLGLVEAESSKAHLLAAIGKDAPKTWKASEIIQHAASHIEGRGGGKPDMAQAGGVKVAGIKDALAAAEAWLQQNS